MKRLQFCLVLLCTLTLALGAFAQVQNGQFTGEITDPSGAAIANAVFNATGVRVRDFPITLAKLLPGLPPIRTAA